jgi:hypothetical protein
LVAVGQRVVTTCAEQGYIGAFTVTVANPTIASVEQFNAQQFTLFNVTGLKAGTTTFSLEAQGGGTGSDTIVVSP